MKKLQRKPNSSFRQNIEETMQTRSASKMSNKNDGEKLPPAEGTLVVDFAEILENTCPGRTTSGSFRQTHGSQYQNKQTKGSPLRTQPRKFMTPKLQRLLATKHVDFGGKPIQNSTFTTNGFNNRKWESTAFEATNSQLVQLLHSTKSV